jgi:simple sugar transport system permease protein
MMLSYVALYITSYMVNYPFIAPPGWVAQTVPITPSAELPRILPPTQLSAAIYIAIGMAALVALVLDRTVLGYEVRAVGLNTSAAESNGINVKNTMILAFVMSGALAGLGGAGEILGVHRRFINGFSPCYGFDGLAVGLIGGLNPIGTVFAAILIGALRAGGMTMNTATGVPIDIVSVLQGLVVLFVAAPRLISYLARRGVATPRPRSSVLTRIRALPSGIKRIFRRGGT